MIFGICEMYGKSGSECIVRIETNEHDELPIHALFLFGSDGLHSNNWLSGNWESTRSHIDEVRPIDDSYGVDLTLVFAP